MEWWRLPVIALATRTDSRTEPPWLDVVGWSSHEPRSCRAGGAEQVRCSISLSPRARDGHLPYPCQFPSPNKHTNLLNCPYSIRRPLARSTCRLGVVSRPAPSPDVSQPDCVLRLLALLGTNFPLSSRRCLQPHSGVNNE